MLPRVSRSSLQRFAKVTQIVSTFQSLVWGGCASTKSIRISVAMVFAMRARLVRHVPKIVVLRVGAVGTVSAM